MQQSDYDPCTANKCLITDRHCDITDNKDGNIYLNNKDPLCYVHGQIWDSTHFYVAHLSELGLRAETNNATDDRKPYDEFRENCERDEWNIIDHELVAR